MWNSGAIGIPYKVLTSTLTTALNLCDSLLEDGITNFTLEQWAVGIALKKHTGRIEPLDKHMWHYWHYKYIWGNYISKIFNQAEIPHNREKDWMLEKIRKINFPLLYWKLLFKRTVLKIFGMEH